MSYIHISHSAFSLQWERVYNNHSLRNFTITASSKEYKVNKACIIAASRHFADFLVDDDTLQSAPLPPEVNASDFELLLDYLYTGQLKFPHNRLWSITKSAATLYLEKLYESLADEIASKLNVENCFDTLKTAQKLRLELVQIRSAEFIANNMAVLIRNPNIETVSHEVIRFCLKKSTERPILVELMTIVMKQIGELKTPQKQSAFFQDLLLRDESIQKIFFGIYLSEDNCIRLLNMAEAASLPNVILDRFWAFIIAHVSNLVKNINFRLGTTLEQLKKLLANRDIDRSVEERLFMLAEQKLKMKAPSEYNRSFKSFFEQKDIQTRYAKNYLNVENCLKIIQDSYRNELLFLFNLSADFIAERFWEVIHSDSFLSLPPPLFIKIMHSRKRPLYFKEEDAFFLLERWTDQDPKQRKQYFLEGMRGVRLTHIQNLDLMKTKMAFSDYVYDDKAAKKLLKMAIRFGKVNSNHDFLSAKMNLAHTVKPPPFIYAPSCLHQQKQVLTALFGLETKRICQLENNEWQSYEQQFVSNGQCVAVALGDRIVVFNKSARSWLTLSTEGVVSTQKNALFSSMMCSNNALHQDRFISADVFNESSLCGAVFVMDSDLAVLAKLPVKGDKTSEESEIQYRSQYLNDGIGMCCDSDELFIVGDGPGGGPFTGVKSLRLDESCPVWCRQSSLHQARWQHAVVPFEKSIFAIAGGDGIGYLTSVERFDQRSGKWNQVAQLNYGRTVFGATLFRGEIWVAGGWAGSPLDSVEIFCPRTNSWRLGPKLPEATDNFGFVCFDKFN